MPKTIEEIAQKTGFSVTTVRLIANGQAEKYRISKATTEIVEGYIRRHGYVVNHAARSLKLNRTDAIGLIVPAITNAFFARLMAELERLCGERGLVLLTASTNENPELEDRAIYSLWARGVDGLIIAPCRLPDYGRIVGKKSRAAIVTVDRPYAASPYPAIASDNFQGCLALTRGMFEDGGTDTAFLCANPDSPSITDRIRGFSAACVEAGIADGHAMIHQAPTDCVASGAQLMDRLFDQRGCAPRSFMCSSLLVLEGASQRLKQRIGQIPIETIMGTFDDHPMLDFLSNPVLSVRQNEAVLASLTLARLLGESSAGDPPPHITTVACELVHRGRPAGRAPDTGPEPMACRR